jgi:hypothetical protein
MNPNDMGLVTKKGSINDSIMLKELTIITNSLQDISLDNWSFHKLSKRAPGFFRSFIKIDPLSAIGSILKEYDSDTDRDRCHIYRVQWYDINSVIIQIARVYVYANDWQACVDINCDKIYNNPNIQNLQKRLIGSSLYNS